MIEGVPPSKICSKCGESKSETDFRWEKRRGKFGAQCLVCIRREALEYHRANPEKHRRACKKWADKNPEKVRRIRRKFKLRKYGITESRHTELLQNQKGRCAICGTYALSLKIDHCHSYGTVRGLLCHPCNTGLGMFRDRPEFLISAAKYLQKYHV